MFTARWIFWFIQFCERIDFIFSKIKTVTLTINIQTIQKHTHDSKFWSENVLKSFYFLFVCLLIFTVQYLIKKGVVAIVGPMTSTGVKFTQPYCAGFHIPQLAPVATDPTFSFTPANFPFLVRLSPSDTIQCQALAGLISYYNWSQISLLTSKDDYGLYMFLCFNCFFVCVCATELFYP